jgi:hypothetical protein
VLEGKQCDSGENNLPMLLLPKNLPALVEDDGGGGFWICEAVGARDWRMEYVRCILGESYRFSLEDE